MSWETREAQLAQVEKDTPRSRGSADPLPPTPSLDLDQTPYVELHLHSCFSMLNGASQIEELAAEAEALGYPALALTDDDGLYGSMEFARELRARNIHPITGVDLTVAEHDDPEAPRSHLTLLAESRAGYANLCRLISHAHGLLLEDAKQRDTRRKNPWLALDALREHSEGLILLSGCRKALIPSLVAEERHTEAETLLRRLLAWFGPDNVFVELQDNLVHGDMRRNRDLVELAGRAGVEVVGTGAVHYHQRQRHRLHDVLTATRHRKTLEESHRERLPNDEFYLRPPAEQALRFAAYHPEAARNSVRIAQRCAFDITEDLGYQLPSPDLGEKGTPDDRLREVCEQALRRKYTTTAERRAGHERLEEELALISKNNLSGFFLIYHDVFDLAKEVAEEVRGPNSARGEANLPVGRGRGSSVASIVCFLIGLSHIDPVKNNLFIGRFLNDNLQTLPDIDVDFPRDIRERLIERVYERWGRDHAALVAAFPTYRMRSAVRDVGKALGLPLAQLGRISRLSHPFDSAAGLHAAFQRYPEFAEKADAPIWRELLELVPLLQGMPRHPSEHVGGMVIASQPLIDCVPCQPAAWEGRYVCQWDKDSVDDARMVKIDFLSLGMLSAAEEMIELIAATHGRTVDLSRIDFQDEAVYEDICNGDTVGVFQIESRSQIAMLPRSQPRTLDDLGVQVAIVRPGPIVGGAVNPYVRRRVDLLKDPEHYQPPMPYESEALRAVLDETLGVVIFQEQVLQVAEIMGGFSPAQAESFRRAMSRKRSHEIMESYRDQFLQGAAERDVAPRVAERVFENLKGFAEFGFPKSHAAAFALLAYQTAWLKRYYPAEFACALFNNQPMGFYPPHVLTNDAKRHGIAVLRPEINTSRTGCSVEPPDPDHLGAVRIGLGYVQQVGEAGALAIERARATGPFTSLFDFVQRTGLARRATQSLIQIGAFDAFGLNRRELIWQLGLLGEGLERSALRIPQERQLRLALATQQDEVALPDFSPYQRMAADYELLHLSPDSHPMQFLRPQLGEGVVSSNHLRSLSANAQVTIAGLVVCRQRPLTAKGIVFLLLEDEFGMVNVMVNRELDEKYLPIVRASMFVAVDGILEERAGEQRTIVATSLRELLPAAMINAPAGKSWG